MLTLIRLLFKIFGVSTYSRARWSGVATTIESLPGSNLNKQLLGGALHVLPVIAILLYTYFCRANSWSISRSEGIALSLACSWVFFGSQQIWYYETVMMRVFVIKYRHLIANMNEAKDLKASLYDGIYKLKINIVFTIFWICVIAAGYWASRNFVSSLIGSANLFSDWLFYVLSVGVLMSYYTSIGFCFAFKAVYITALLKRCRLKNNIYYHDGVFGLSCIGDLAFQTSLMFCTGWLFAPLIVLIGKHNGTTALYVSDLVLFIYFISTIVTFMIPIYLIHLKLYESKEILIKNFYEPANRAYLRTLSKWSEESQKQFDFYEKVYARIRAIPLWPLNFDTTLKILTTSVIVPIIVGIVSAYLKGTPKLP
jgi:hypothetical protein